MNRPLIDYRDTRPDEAIRVAESLGFLAIPQWFAIVPVTDESGAEWALSAGPLRYSLERAAKDAQAAIGPASVCCVVRYSDPNEATELDDYQRHVQAREAERRGE